MNENLNYCEIWWKLEVVTTVDRNLIKIIYQIILIVAIYEIVNYYYY